MARFLAVLLLPLLGFAAMPAADPPTPPAPKGETLTKERASAFAKLALKGARKQYPNKTGHVQLDDADTKTPKQLHPAFFGCYDWHSAVHGHWMLVRVLRTHQDLPEAKDIRAVLGEHLTADKLKAEAEYFNRPEAKSYERPYGWTWLLKLAEELHTWDDPDAKNWSANVKPLAELIANRYIEYFPKQTYPIRAGSTRTPRSASRSRTTTRRRWGTRSSRN
jgi:hypothetical protein